MWVSNAPHRIKVMTVERMLSVGFNGRNPMSRKLMSEIKTIANTAAVWIHALIIDFTYLLTLVPGTAVETASFNLRAVRYAPLTK